MLAFNNFNIQDELNTKLLLMMPMVPPTNHKNITLDHLKNKERLGCMNTLR